MSARLPLLPVLCVASALVLLGCADDGSGEALDGDDPADAGVAPRDASISAHDGAAREAGARDASDPTDAPFDDAAGTGDDRRSAGCGSANTGSGAFARRSLRAGGRDRTYYVRVPASYQANRAYPLIFRWHGTGGDGLSGGLDIERAAGDDAIVVGADGLVQHAGSDAKAWGSATEADDLALFDALYQQLGQEYCIDLERVFSYGFSAGGGMTNMLSCKRGDKLRASAAVAGYVWGDQSRCGPAVAAWFLHDRNDETVTVDMGREGRDLALERNDCGSARLPAANDCVSYDGCKLGYPVVWCETRGLGHDIAGDTAPAQVWAFFEALPD